MLMRFTPFNGNTYKTHLPAGAVAGGRATFLPLTAGGGGRPGPPTPLLPLGAPLVASAGPLDPDGCCCCCSAACCPVACCRSRHHFCSDGHDNQPGREDAQPPVSLREKLWGEAGAHTLTGKVLGRLSALRLVLQLDASLEAEAAVAQEVPGYLHVWVVVILG